MSLSSVLIEKIKKAWADQIPNNWKYVHFNDVLSLKHRPVQVVDDIVYTQPVIRRGHGGIEIRDQQLGVNIKTKVQFRLNAGDWLMSKVQILHRAYGIVPNELDGAIASGSYYSFEFSENIDAKYFWYLSHLQTFHDSCALASVGVVIEKMVFRVSEWLDFQFPLPPLHEQRLIADILSSVDDAIAATQAVIEQTKTVKQATLERLLTKGIDHTRFKQTEIGEIPESWNVMNLSQIATIDRGKFSIRPRNDPRYFGGDIPFVQTGDVVAAEGRLVHHSQTLNEEGFKVSKSFPVNTILITIAANIGDTAITTYSVCCPDSVVGIVPTVNVNVNWLREFLVLQKPTLNKKATQNAQKNINLQHLRPILIPLPSTEEQEKIGQYICSVNDELLLLNNEINQLKVFKSALMSDLLTGRKRVTDTLPLAAE